ncbi:membrane hypothetical protein [Gammaproteobacteria bacterium]
MRTLVWAMLIVMLITAFPSMAATNEAQSSFPLLDENIGTQYSVVTEHPARSFTFKSTIQRLSIGQMISFISGGFLGGYVATSLVGRVIGRYANTPDRVAFLMMGTIFGAILGGQWCDDGWWPC